MEEGVMRAWVIVVAFIVFIDRVPVSATAPPGDAQVYDLAACIRAALKNDQDLAAAAADLALARARLSETRANRYGQDEYTQLLGFVNEAHGDPTHSTTSKNALFNGLGPFTKLDLALNIPLWTFGKLDAALKAAQQALESEGARGEAKRAEVIFSTKELYYGLLLSQQLSAVLHDNLDTLNKAVKKTQERLDAGSTSVTEIDLLKLKAGRAKFEKGVVEVDASMGLTRSALARMIAVPGGEGFDIVDKKLQPVEITVDPLEAYLADGPERRPETRQIATGVAAQSAKLDLEEAGYYPNIFLTAGFQYASAPNRTTQGNPFAYDDFNYIHPVGVLGMRWDLNFFMTGAKVEQARAELERLHAQQRQAMTGMQLDIRRAYSDVTQSRETMSAAEEGRKAGRALLILTVSNFDLGIGEAEELFKGLATYTESSADYLRAVHDFDVAVGALSKAVGKELTQLQY
jgi:outer membrane protein TolC